MSIAKKISVTIACLLLTVLGVGYFVGMAFFQTHLKIGTVINGFHCSFKTAEEAEELLAEELGGYALAVKTRNGGVEKVTSDEAGMMFVGYSEIEDIIYKQDSVLWFLPETKNITLSKDSYRLDEEKLKRTVSDLDCMKNIVEGKTAKIVNSNGTYQVSPGIVGTNIDEARVLKAVRDAVLSWSESVDLEKEGCYIDVTKANEKALQKRCNFLNSIRGTIITYDFGDRKETVTMDVIEQELLDKKFKLSENLARKYAESLAEKYDTVGIERKFMTFDDKAVMVSGGDYGWKIDIEKTAKDLINLISDCTINVSEPVYSQKAASRNLNDVGYSYLEISVKNGDAVLYKNGTPVVQTKIKAVPGLQNGFWKADIEDDGIFFDGFRIVGPVNSGNADCLSITEESAYEKILAGMRSEWPIVVYGIPEE